MADEEQLCKNHIIGEGREAEERSSQSPPEKKQKLDEKSDGAEEMEDSDGAEEEEEEEDESDGAEGYDSNDSGYFIIDHARYPISFKDAYLPIDMDAAEVEEAEVDVDKWNKYYQEIRESGGFDIDHYPGDCIMANYRPLDVNAATHVSQVQRLIDFCVPAINEFNQKEGTHYSFEKLEKATVRLWDSGANYYLTFRAKESVAGASKTFQALVFWDPDRVGSESRVVKFYRLKAAAAT